MKKINLNSQMFSTVLIILHFQIIHLLLINFLRFNRELIRKLKDFFHYLVQEKQTKILIITKLHSPLLLKETLSGCSYVGAFHKSLSYKKEA